MKYCAFCKFWLLVIIYIFVIVHNQESPTHELYNDGRLDDELEPATPVNPDEPFYSRYKVTVGYPVKDGDVLIYKIKTTVVSVAGALLCSINT